MKRSAAVSLFRALRQRRRAVLLGVLPALNLFAASTASCLAAPTGAASAATPHGLGAAASAHHAAPAPHEATTHVGTNGAPCTHCGHDRIAHAACASGAEIGPALDSTHGPHDKVAKSAVHNAAPWPVPKSLARPTARAGPASPPPTPRQPIRLRHCVLLI
jgi:hypothetical protein